MTGNSNDNSAVQLKNSDIVAMAVKYRNGHKNASGETMPQAEFGRLIGYESSTMSLWFRGKLDNPASINEKVMELLDKERRRKDVKTPGTLGYAETSISKEIMGMLNYCQELKTCVGIFGDPGVGKSFTAERWIRGRNDAIFIRLAPAISSGKAFLKRLARELGVKTSGLYSEIYAAIEEQLAQTDYIIIIDEAQFFKPETVDNLRVLAECTNTALALIGNELIKSKVFNPKDERCRQVNRRFCIRKCFLTDLFTIDDIYKIFGEGIEKSVAKKLLEVAKSETGLSGAVFLYINASNNDNLTEKGLEEAAKGSGIHAAAQPTNKN